MARRSDHSREELKKLTLEESWEIIGQDGFEGLTARKIAKNIGYAPGTIYNLFASMDDLYLALNAKTLDLLFDVLNNPQCHDQAQSSVQNMKHVAKNYMVFAQDYGPYWFMLFNLKLTENRADVDWYQEKVAQLFIPLEKLLEPYFSDKESKKRKMAARVLWAWLHGLCFLQETGKMSIVGHESSASDMSEYLIDTFIEGIER